MKNKLVTGNTTNTITRDIDKIIENNESLFVLDNTHAYIKRYYKQLNEKGYDIVIIDIRNLESTECFNPLLYPYHLYKNDKKDQAIELLEVISSALFMSKGSKDPFWERSAADLFVGTVLSLFEKRNKDIINFNSVTSIWKLEYPAFKEYFDRFDKNSDVGIFVSNVVFAPTETRGGILSVALQKLRLFSSRENLSKFLAKTTFNFEDLANNKKAIFFHNYDDFNLYNKLSDVFFKELYYLLNDTKSHSKFNFVLDNFDSMDLVNDFEEILNSSKSKNLYFIMSARSQEKIIDIYGKYILEILDIVVDNNESSDYQECEVVYPDNRLEDINIIDLSDFKRDKKINDILELIDKKIEELEKEN